MSGEEIRAREEFGALSGCFVEGDPEQQRGQRRVKRRALALSVSLQIVALAAIILLPLLGKAERISLAIATPIPPYRHYSRPVVKRPSTAPQTQPSSCRFCFSPHFRPVASSHDNPANSGTEGPGDEIPIPGTGGPDNVPLVDPRPSTPPPPAPPPVKRLVTHLEPAMLVHRVEPVYPHLAIQVRKEGRVELRAIVSTDGTIQSLQVVSGDAFFIQSALDAVRQWRYRPTILNGQAVEVDTTISVIYALAH